MTTEDPNKDKNPTPETPVVRETPAPAEPVVARESVNPLPATPPTPPARRSPRPLAIAGAILGAVLLLAGGFAIGHWAVRDGNHDNGHRVQRSIRPMQNLGQMLGPNRQGNNRSPPGGAAPDLSQLRGLLQGLMQNRGMNNSGGNSSGSDSSNLTSQLDQLQKQVQQLQTQVQQLQSQLQSGNR